MEPSGQLGTPIMMRGAHDTGGQDVLHADTDRPRLPVHQLPWLRRLDASAAPRPSCAPIRVFPAPASTASRVCVAAGRPGLCSCGWRIGPRGEDHHHPAAFHRRRAATWWSPLGGGGRCPRKGIALVEASRAARGYQGFDGSGKGLHRDRRPDDQQIQYGVREVTVTDQARSFKMSNVTSRPPFIAAAGCLSHRRVLPGLARAGGGHGRPGPRP